MTPVEIARSYLGTKWVHQGRTSKGMDCVGLMRVAFPGLPWKEWNDYGRNPVDGLLEKRARLLFGPPIPPRDMRPGDAVLMAFPTAVRHCGLIGDHPKGLSLIHTYQGVGKHGGFVVEHRLDKRWLERIRFVHRIGASA